MSGSEHRFPGTAAEASEVAPEPGLRYVHSYKVWVLLTASSGASTIYTNRNLVLYAFLPLLKAGSVTFVKRFYSVWRLGGEEHFFYKR